MPANPFVVDFSLITGVRFGNVTPCPGPHNLSEVSSGLTNITIGSFDPHLRSDSPAVNAGSLDLAPADDFTGHPRDVHPDIGAYER